MKKIDKSWCLFLDDERIPENVKWPILEVGKFGAVALPSKNWTIIRNYDDFCKKIEEDGMPSVVAFDHDLADEHYQALMNDKGKHVVSYDTFKERTGYHCAKWMIDYCFQFKLEIPNDIFVHSMNPIGAEKIRDLILCARKFIDS